VPRIDGKDYYFISLTGMDGLQMSEVDQRPVMMNFQVSWGAASQGDGTSFSRNFTIVRDTSQILSVASYDSGYFSNESPAFQDSFNGGETPGRAAATTLAGAPTSSPTSGVSSSLSPSTAPASSSGGLAAGAIAGIAVGAAVAVLLAASLLAWYLIRRRRRQQQQQGDGVHHRASPYGRGRSRTADLMAEKEAATAGVSESPTHSPYSDDNLGRTGGGGGAAAAAAAVATTAMLSAHDHDADRSTVPYTDVPSPSSPHQHQRTGSVRSGSLAGVGGGGRSSVSERGGISPVVAAAATTTNRSSVVRSGTPQGMMGGGSGGRYAHLMDDGMSPEEVARIEAEEAALDEAIERAGRQRTS